MRLHVYGMQKLRRGVNIIYEQKKSTKEPFFIKRIRLSVTSECSVYTVYASRRTEQEWKQKHLYCYKKSELEV